ncbi:S-DNA-T family DNA segregation ATPase FtsK/SpoIIIE [Bacillus oleivorans]|uniref:S-DNA-T family DNA segregation ATPase FtsK/SpoIIIE n=1 Tax=Bacillus oleivorans TaxID=1448271 RepID=A0A285D650_9BACI|nr:FtsK/SpoIIIE domain-containing protein [Bacillus oleivorans]SNX75297.1 S-DNA-T family DNA segregation ATPase FtsK/SpoIIIE [Bacillus oleivorans]
MLEWMIPLAVGTLAIVTKAPNKSDRKKIETIMRNVNYGVRKTKGEEETFLYPTYKKKQKLFDGYNHIGMRYFYTIPLGLPATKLAKMEKEVKVFTDGLQKPVEVAYKKGLLQFSVYDEEIPEMFPYEALPDKEGWFAPIGKRFDGLVWHNFDHVPHMTVAGTTRFGKTVFLKVLMTYLIEHHPDDIELYLIDLKGGLEFGPYERLKQVRRVASNAEEGALLLTEIHERMERMYRYFRTNGWTNVIDTPEQKRIFIIVDEAAQLAPEKWMTKEQKDLLGMCQYFLGEITRIGGALGFREVFCTQYPTADTLPRSVKQNSDAKVSFRLPSGYASQVAIDDYGAEELPSDIKGRALFKTHELREMQVPYISDKEMKARLKQWEVKNHDPHHAPKNEEQTGEDTFYIR